MVSVVIPVRNGADLLPVQLEALARQQYEHDWEIIVVDNGSTDDSADVARSWADKLPVQVVSANDKPGVSYARNVGISAARGELIALCDADDEVSDGWLRALLEACTTADAVGGAIDLEKLNNAVAVSWNSLTLTTQPRLAGAFLPAVGAGNLAVWSDVATALHGFNEDYEYGAEDIEFCWRLQLAGYRLGFSQDALVHVRSRDDLRSLARQFYHYGQGSPRLYRDFRSRGMPRSSIRHALKGWGWLVVHFPDLIRGHSRRGNWIRAAATRVGKAVGSVQHGTVYL